MKKLVPVIAAFTLLASFSAHAETIQVAAAADLKFAMTDVVKSFEKKHPGDKINVSYGSSGKFFTQIAQGAPYALYFSADIKYPKMLQKYGLTASQPKLYAIGRIVLWSPTLDAGHMTLDNLTDKNITRIAIANPKHAPYGLRAEEALKSAGIWDKIQHKLVFGENIAQTTQFVQSGNAQIGIIALSLAKAPELGAKTTGPGSYYLIPADRHEPLEQAYVITKKGADSKLAHEFAAYMSSPQVIEIMRRFGFILPQKNAQ